MNLRTVRVRLSIWLISFYAYFISHLIHGQKEVHLTQLQH